MRYALDTTLMLIAVIAIASPVSAADSRSFRVVGNQQYQILEAKDIYLYSADILVRKGTADNFHKMFKVNRLLIAPEQ